jgi:hypothetical protein
MSGRGAIISVVDVLTITGSVVGTLVAFTTLWQLWLRWRAHGVSQLRDLAPKMRRIFGDIVAHHGQPTTVFLSGAGVGLETQLDDLRDQLRDGELRSRARELERLWREVFACAPPVGVGTFSTKGSGAITYRSDLMPLVERQVAAAREGQVAVQRLLDRCNEVTHPIVLS